MRVLRSIIITFLLSLITIPTIAINDAPQFEESECPFYVENDSSVTCGYVAVPENRSVPNGSTIRIAVAVFDGDAYDAPDDPIFALSGGPASHAISGAYWRASSLRGIAGGRDIVIFDQRGVGESQPALLCPEYNSVLTQYLGQPMTLRLQQEIAIESLHQCGETLSAQGIDLTAYNTRENAADVNAIRMALGYDKINLVGVSYGTRLGLETLRLYPQHIRSAILDSVVPPQVDLIREWPVNTKAAFDRFFAACLADSECNHVFPDLEAVYYNLIDQLDADPLLQSVYVQEDYEDLPFIGDDLASVVWSRFYYGDATANLPRSIYSAAHGNYLEITSFFGSGSIWNYSLGMRMTTICQDENTFAAPAGFDVSYPYVFKAMSNLTSGNVYNSVCSDWHLPLAAEALKTPVYSDVPALILAGEFDPVTPVEWSAMAAETLSNSYFYEFPGIGHNVLVDECAESIAVAFMEEPTATPDSTCIGNMPGMRFNLPNIEGVSLAPVEIFNTGIEVLIPADWEETATGLFTSPTSADTWLMVSYYQGMARDDVLATFVRRHNLELSAHHANRTINGVRWSLYTPTRSPSRMAFAIGEVADAVIMLALSTNNSSFDSLYFGAYLPALNAIQPGGV